MRFPIGVAVIVLSVFSAAQAVGEAANAVASDRQEARSYRDIATLDSPGGGISGTGRILWPSGITVVPIDTGASSNCRFAISMATGRQGADPKTLRVLAKDGKGNLHTASAQSGVAASGNKYALVTIVCDFPLPEKEVRQLTLQRQEAVLVDLGIVKARIIIQDDEEEERLGLLPP